MERDRHEFIRRMCIMEEMEEEEEEIEGKDEEKDCTVQGYGTPAGVRVIPEDDDEW